MSSTEEETEPSPEDSELEEVELEELAGLTSEWEEDALESESSADS